MRSMVACLALGVVLSGCAASVKRVLPETVRTVAVARLQNATDQDLLPALFDEELRRAFRLDGRLAVVEDPAAADALLDGTIAAYARTPSRFSNLNVVEEYLVRLTVEVTLTAPGGRGTLWADRGAKPVLPGAAASATTTASSAPPGPSTRRLATETHYVVVPASGLPVESEEDAQRRLVRDLAADVVVRALEGW